MMGNNGGGHNNGNQYIGSFTDYYHDSLVITVKGLEVTYERILTIFATLDFSILKQQIQWRYPKLYWTACYTHRP